MSLLLQSTTVLLLLGTVLLISLTVAFEGFAALGITLVTGGVRRTDDEWLSLIGISASGPVPPGEKKPAEAKEDDDEEEEEGGGEAAMLRSPSARGPETRA